MIKIVILNQLIIVRDKIRMFYMKLQFQNNRYFFGQSEIFNFYNDDWIFFEIIFKNSCLITGYYLFYKIRVTGNTIVLDSNTL